MKLKGYQREDVETVREHNNRALIASEPGTGKTAIAITLLREGDPQGCMPALIVCPASVVKNWRKEFKLWAPEIETVLITDTTSRIPRAKGPTAYITSWALLDIRYEDLVLLGLNAVIADEGHLAKNPDALRSQALWDLMVGRNAHTRMILTGTPVVNREGELNIILEYLGPGAALIRRLFEEANPDVPEKVRKVLPFELSPKDRIIYDKMSEDFGKWFREERAARAALGDEVSIARSLAGEALVRIGYLRRFVGECKAEPATEWVAKAVRYGEQVAVFAEHSRAIARLSRNLNKLRIKHVVLDGDLNIDARQDAVDAFQEARVPVFIGSKAAITGITLVAARHSLMMERYYTSAEEDQTEDRIRRIGQTRKTHVWRLHAVDTIDDRMDEIVMNKRQIVRDAVGSADVSEDDIAAVQEMLLRWGQAGSVYKNGRMFEGGVATSALPEETRVQAIVFKGWSRERASRWCKLNGYRTIGFDDYGNRIRAVVAPSRLFKKGTFKAERIGPEISIYTGERIKGARRAPQRKTK